MLPYGTTNFNCQDIYTTNKFALFEAIAAWYIGTNTFDCQIILKIIYFV